MSNRISLIVMGMSFALFFGYYLFDVSVLTNAIQSQATWAVMANDVLTQLASIIPKTHRYLPYFSEIFDRVTIERYARLNASCVSSAFAILCCHMVFRLATRDVPLFVHWVKAGLRVSGVEKMRAMTIITALNIAWYLLIGFGSAQEALAVPSLREPISGPTLLFSPIGSSALLIGAIAFVVDLTILVHQMKKST